MCYYNGVKVTKSEFIRLKQIEKAVAKYNFLSRPVIVGFDYPHIPVVKRVPGKEDFDIVEMEWGFIPDPNVWPFVETRDQLLLMRHGGIDPAGNYRESITTLNAVSEELLFKNKIYRQAALHRRCLVLSTGFYEWRHIIPVSKKTGKPLKTKVKYPYHIRLKGQEYFFMAGIWNPWQDADSNEYVESVSIITTRANELMAQIHNAKKRMPTILDEDLASEWIYGDLTEDRISEVSRHQFESYNMEAWTVKKSFLSELDPSAPFHYPDVPPLGIDEQRPGLPDLRQPSLF